jgi:hydrogenase nickel incorporation protein HypA/HybF
MHEVSLAGGILKIVEQSAKTEHFARVTHLRLEVGSLSGVEVRALRFAMEAIAPGTVLQHAKIAIDEIDGQAWCMPCAKTVNFVKRGNPCPDCGSYQLQASSGTELRIIDMLVEDT